MLSIMCKDQILCYQAGNKVVPQDMCTNKCWRCHENGPIFHRTHYCTGWDVGRGPGGRLTCDKGVSAVGVISHQWKEDLPWYKGAEQQCLNHLWVDEKNEENNRLIRRRKEGERWRIQYERKIEKDVELTAKRGRLGWGLKTRKSWQLKR